MRLQVAKWGNSLAIRVPAAYAKRVGIANGDTLEATIAPNGELRITPPLPQPENKGKMVSRLAQLQRELPTTASVIETLRDEARY